jgi:hypothetical protein
LMLNHLTLSVLMLSTIKVGANVLSVIVPSVVAPRKSLSSAF